MNAVVITVDGPSGAGKGTLCKLLAERLGYHLLDSGALYRLTALAAEQQGADFDDEEALSKVAENLDVEFRTGASRICITLQGQDVTDAIRRESVGMNASKVAASQAVRDALLQRQRDFAVEPGLVADGRDMGTTVFPQASIKVFLTADAEERARRRVLQLEQAGSVAEYEEVLNSIVVRDKQDRERQTSPLVAADDAFVLDSTQLDINQVLAEVIALVEQN